MRERIRYHYQGNAEGSTLRLTLGCLLSEELDIELRRVGSGKRMTFAEGGGGYYRNGWPTTLLRVGSKTTRHG